MYNLTTQLQDKRVCPELKDKMVWNLSKNGIFTFISSYGTLVGNREGSFPRKLIWNYSIPTKISFFVGEAW